MDKGSNFLGLVLLTLMLLPLSALTSLSYVTFDPLLYHVAVPKVGEHHLNPASPYFSYYVYNFTLRDDELEIENLITHELAKFDISSNSITILTVSNTSIVYVYSSDILLEAVLTQANVSSYKEFKLSGKNRPWYVHGWVLLSSRIYTTWTNFTSIEVENGSNEYLFFTPSGSERKFEANVTSFYESGRLLLLDLVNSSTLLVGAENVSFRGLLEFPYSFKGKVIFYNSTSGYLEEYNPAQGGQSLSTVQQPFSKIKEIRDIQEMLYLGNLVVISIHGQRPSTLIYSLNGSLVGNVTDQVTRAVFNVSGTYVFYGNNKTSVIDDHFNMTRIIPNSTTYCASGTVVVEYLAPSGTNKVYIPATNQSFSLQGIDVGEQPIPLGQSLLAFPEGSGEDGLTWLWVVSLKNLSRFQVLSFYSNTTYEFDDVYYFYKGTIYSQTSGTLVSITTVNASGYVEISGGTISVELRAGNVSLVLPNGEYVLAYNNATEVLNLSGKAIHVDLNELHEYNSTSTAATQTTSSASSTTISTFTSTLETAPPPVGVAPPPEQAGTVPSVSPAEIVLIALGYISIIGIYLYRRRK